MRTKRTYSIIAYKTFTEASAAVSSIDVQEGIGAEELAARLANKPADMTYRVFAGDEIPWEARQVIDIGAPRERKARTKTEKKPATKKPNGTKFTEQGKKEEETHGAR